MHNGNKNKNNYLHKTTNNQQTNKQTEQTNRTNKQTNKNKTITNGMNHEKQICVTRRRGGIVVKYQVNHGKLLTRGERDKRAIINSLHIQNTQALTSIYTKPSTAQSHTIGTMCKCGLKQGGVQRAGRWRFGRD